MIAMYRPVSSGPTQTPPPSSNQLSGSFFGEKNSQTLFTVLAQDFEEKQRLESTQLDRLSKTLTHYQQEVFQKFGDGTKPLAVLNREVLVACSKDFNHYLQRKNVSKERMAQSVPAAQQVMNDELFQETAQRFERLNKERQGVKTLPPPPPDFRISLSEDGPPAAELFERAKKAREQEALRAASTSTSTSTALALADSGLQQRIQADSSFRSQQIQQNRASEELAIVQRNTVVYPSSSMDTSLVIQPDRRDMFITPIGSFDGMNGAPPSNPTLSQPIMNLVTTDSQRLLPQSVIIKEDNVVHYREVENNLFIYSADRDWLKNNKENRYQFTVQFDPAANGQSFGVNLASQHKFKNIVRIELVKAILPGENLDVTVQRTRGTAVTGTSYQNNILNFPYVTVRVAELENNNYGTDQNLDRSFGVLQYDAQWLADTNTQSSCTKGYLAMIPKHLKCQREYYPTPLSTLQKMTIELCRPNGQLINTTPDTYDIGGIIAPQSGEIMGTVFPFTNTIKYTESQLTYNVMIPIVNGSPANFFINTTKYFSKFEMCSGDRIQISGYTYSEEALNDPTYGGALRSFCQWVNRPEGHVVLDSAYSIGFDLSSNTTSMRNGFNEVGYANFIVIPARYKDPSTGSTELDPFSINFGAVLNAFGVNLQSPVRLINLNKQISLVFRIITREMDSLPQLRPDNNY